MFTGIVECIGEVQSVQHEGSNLIFCISSPISHELKIDQSIAHNGCCLTVTQVIENTHYVTAVAETLKKTNLGRWEKGSFVNLERCTQLNGRLDGHMVQGHIDTLGKIISIEDVNGSKLLQIEHAQEEEFFTVSRGSITVDGISLTVAESYKNTFNVAIIPYTWENTILRHKKTGDAVNLEFDIIGKYVQKILSQRNA